MGQLIERVNVWIQIVTSLAVIAGFGVVVWQLQLSRATATAGFALLNISDASADLNSVYGENAAEVLEKACFNPDEMSNADLIVLQHYFQNKMFRIVNVYWQSVFAGDENWKGPASGFLSTILMYPQGAAFIKGWSTNDPNSSPLELFIEQQIATGSTTPCDEALDRMRVK